MWAHLTTYKRNMNICFFNDIKSKNNNLKLQEQNFRRNNTNWCLNRHLCILPERFAKKDLNLVIVCRKDVTS